ncbi:cilia- and flagella-associated protein 70 isoform X2 [Amblyraja radiata]|uniref:cilia- and flagella-associated protein 70 isoform X2 n=1 Tax=Amblyraja radiata TaxID=386614 RepID=UPI001401BBD6|nr:cilia- and flagella-associated protein 70 isoform X2 [Amblyraja radiata]
MENPEVEIKGRNAVSVQITVLRGRNLKGTKTDNPMSYVRADYNSIHLGDSGKLQVTEGEIEYNFTTSFDCSFDGVQGLDNLVHKPVILTVIEILPKEKKKKDEKTIILGQVTVDLLPLAEGLCTYTKTLTVHPMGGVVLEPIVADETKAALDIALSVPEPLLSEAQLEVSNLMRITVESAYSVPDSWNLTGPQFNYIISLFLPDSTQKDPRIVFSNGILKVTGEKEPNIRPKRWPVSNVAAFGAQNIVDSFIEICPYEDEDGELNSKEDWAFRTEAESEKKRVTWNIERRCFLESDALLSLQKHIAENTYLPVEIKRVPLAPPAKGGKSSKVDKSEEEGPIYFRGVLYVNMAPLLYPGVKRIRGAYPIGPYNEVEIFEKTKHKKSLTRDTSGGKGQSQHSRIIVNKSKEDKGRDTMRKSLVNVKSFITEHGLETEVTGIVNVEGDQYTEAKSYIVLEFSLDKPLVQRRLREDLSKKIAEMIPPRPLFPRRTSGADKAVTDYHNQIISVARIIMDEYQDMFGRKLIEGKLSHDYQDQEERKHKLIFELNTSGKYFAFKEQLKMFHVDPPDPIPESFLSSAQLKHFAKEAEANRNFEIANKYHLERLARDKLNPEHWFDYGTFYLLLNEYVKADECFREAVAVNQEHINSLILCGILACMNEHYEEADNLFESARCFEPNNVLAWTMHGLFYESQEQTILAEMAFLEAKKLIMATETPKRSQDEVIVNTAKETKVPEPEPEDDKKDSQAVTEEIKPVVPDTGSLQSASTAVEVPPETIPDSESTFSQIRKTSFEIVEAKKVIDAVESPISPKQQEEPVPVPKTVQPRKETTSVLTRSIYMQTARFLLDVNALQFVSRALAHEVICTEGGLSCEYHVVLARLYVQQGELGKAEECISEAGRINHQNSDLWALLGHLSYMKEDYAEAKEHYARTLCYVDDAFDMHCICLRLGSIYLQEGEEESYKSAKSVYLFASERAPSCLTWLGVGIACYRLDELRDAEDALCEANILNNSNADVWGYLTLVCLKTGRKLEAEQTYKYAIKLHLEDKQLLDEIHQLQQTLGFGNPTF